MKYSQPLIHSTLDLNFLYLQNQGTGALTPICSGNCDFFEEGEPSSSSLGVECRTVNTDQSQFIGAFFYEGFDATNPNLPNCTLIAKNLQGQVLNTTGCDVFDAARGLNDCADGAVIGILCDAQDYLCSSVSTVEVSCDGNQKPCSIL